MSDNRIRGFEKIEDFAILPTRATLNSAGYDFYSPCDIIIRAKSKGKIETCVKAYMQEDEYLAIYVRSSIAIKKGLELVNQVGIVDSDYYGNSDNDGNIIIWLYNNTEDDVLIRKGERVAQGIFSKYLKTDDDTTKATRTGGFGSSDK